MTIELLYEAAEFADFDPAQGWPEEVTPPQLIALMVGHRFMLPHPAPQPIQLEYPDGRIEQGGWTFDHALFEDAETGRRRKACARTARMLGDKGIKFEERSESIPRPSRRILSLKAGVKFVDEPQPPEIKKRCVITRAAFRDFLTAQGIEPSKYIRAWLLPLEQAEAHQGEAAAPAKPKRETQVGRIKKWVTELERRAADAGEPFDRKRMPGVKAEFLALLHALDVELQSIKGVDSLDRYLRAAGCQWPANARHQPHAVPLYAALFPEARIRAPRATSPQRRKA